MLHISTLCVFDFKISLVWAEQFLLVFQFWLVLVQFNDHMYLYL